MSGLAKAFVVIVAVLSVGFLGVESALYKHRTDWKTEYDQLKSRYNDLANISTREVRTLQGEVREKQSFIQTKDSEVLTLKAELDRLAALNQDANQQLSRRHQENQKLQNNLDVITNQIEEKDKYIRQLNLRIDQQKSDLDVAIRDKETAEAQVARLTNIKNAHERDLEDLRKTFARKTKELRDNELLISMLRDKGVDIESIVYGPPPPPIEGVVVAVRPIEGDADHPLVLLSVGSNDKVAKGYQFSVHRGNEFVAKVVVEKVMPDMAGCRVLFFKDHAGVPIQEGDRASTRLP